MSCGTGPDRTGRSLSSAASQRTATETARRPTQRDSAYGSVRTPFGSDRIGSDGLLSIAIRDFRPKCSQTRTPDWRELRVTKRTHTAHREINKSLGASRTNGRADGRLNSREEKRRGTARRHHEDLLRSWRQSVPSLTLPFSFFFSFYLIQSSSRLLSCAYSSSVITAIAWRALSAAAAPTSASNERSPKRALSRVAHNTHYVRSTASVLRHLSTCGRLDSRTLSSAHRWLSSDATRAAATVRRPHEHLTSGLSMSLAQSPLLLSSFRSSRLFSLLFAFDFSFTLTVQYSAVLCRCSYSRDLRLPLTSARVYDMWPLGARTRAAGGALVNARVDSSAYQRPHLETSSLPPICGCVRC